MTNYLTEEEVLRLRDAREILNMAVTQHFFPMDQEKLMIESINNLDAVINMPVYE